MSFATVPLQSDAGLGGLFAGLVFFLLFGLLSFVVFVAVVAGLWKTFTKAGEPGWAAIVPIYNVYVLLQITDNEVWWLVLFFIPVVNIVAGVKVSLDLAKAFGQGLGFALGLVFLPFVFFPLLGFGKYQFVGVQQYGGGYNEGMVA